MEAIYHAFQHWMLCACLAGLGMIAALVFIAKVAAPAWDAVRRWWSLPCIQRVIVGVCVVGLSYYGATKQGWHVGYDGGIKAGATANVVTNDTVSIHWQRDTSGGVYVPESAAVYIDYRPNTETNAEWGLLAQTTVGAWGWSGTVENATNYDYNVWAYYIPPEPVHTNGVWTYKTMRDRAEKYVLPLRATVTINNRVISPPNRYEPPVPYDAEVEYLQTPTMTAANQYSTRIDTGISPTVDTEVFLDFLFINALAGDQICAARTGTASVNRFFVFASSSGGRVVLGNWATTNLGLVGQRHTILFNEYQTHHYYIDGVDKGAMGYTQYTKGNDNHLLLFATTGYEPSYGTSNSRIYSCRIRVGGVLVRDYIAVRKDGVGYLYDRVSGQLFGNAGTGAFIIGPDK